MGLLALLKPLLKSIFRRKPRRVPPKAGAPDAAALQHEHGVVIDQLPQARA